MGHPGHTRWRVAWIISVRTYRAWYLLRFFMKPTSFSACIISIRPFRFVSEEEIEGHPAAPCVNDNTYCTAEMFLATRGTWHKEILRSPCASHVWRKRFFFSPKLILLLYGVRVFFCWFFPWRLTCPSTEIYHLFLTKIVCGLRNADDTMGYSKHDTSKKCVLPPSQNKCNCRTEHANQCEVWND
jgi:hypothetical protein